MTRLGRQLLQAAALAAIVTGMGIGGAMLLNVATAQHATVEVPIFEVDPLWPKPLPNEGLLGMAIGVSVDSQDNVWMVHRSSQTLHNNEKGAELNPPIAACCRGAPPVLASIRTATPSVRGADQAKATNGRNRCTASLSTIRAMFGSVAMAQRMLKSSNSARTASSCCSPAIRARMPAATIPRTSGVWHRSTSIRRPMKATWPTATATGGWRWWTPTLARSSDTGAPTEKSPTTPRTVHVIPTGRPLSSTAAQCTASRCRMTICSTSATGRATACRFSSPTALSSKRCSLPRTRWHRDADREITFSRDPEQRFIYLTDGQNERVRIVKRDTMTELASFGRGGRQPGQFYGVHSIAVNSKGNIYTTETYEGKRIQKFVFKGIGSVPAGEQGSLWPRRGS